jgi:hypothetical protein
MAKRLVPAAFLVLCVLAVGLSPAAASAAWSGVVPLSADNGETDTAQPEVTTDSAGEAVAAWFQKDPTTHGLNGVAYATRGAEGVWTPRSYISAPGEAVIAGLPTPVLVAEAPSGQALIGWAAGANRGLIATQRPGAVNAFAAPVGITGGAVTCANNPSLTDDEVLYPSAGMGAGGNGWIAWYAPCGGTEFGRRAYVRPLQGGGFGTPLDAGTMEPDGGSIVGPALTVDPTTGLGAIAYSPEAASPLPLFTRSLNQTSGLGAPFTVASGGRQVALATGPTGEPIAAYIVTGEAVFARDGEGAVARLSPAGQNPAGAVPRIAASPDGTVVVAWRDVEGSVWAAVRHTGAWAAAQKLSDPGAEEVHVAIAADDVAYVTWRREVSQFDGVEASVMDPGDPSRSPGAPWSFQPTPEVVVDAAEGTLPSTVAAEVTGSALTVRPDGVATIAVTWRDSLPEHPPTHVVGVTESAAPVGIAGEAPGGEPGGASGGNGGGTSSGNAGGPATPAPPASGKPGKDTRPPALTVFNASRTIFATGSKLDKKVADREDKTVIHNGLPKSGLQVGTIFKWTQDEAGKATIAITYEGCSIFGKLRPAPGYGVCTSKDKRGVVVYKKTVSAARGANSLTYLGAATKGVLDSGGAYVARLTATDAAGNESKPKTLRFTVDAPAAG